MPTPLSLLRDWMAAQHVESFYLPIGDPHSDEYTPAHWQLLPWLTGFTGSAGTVVVTADKAALWTDSRYWLQAAAELEGTGIELMRDGKEGVPDPISWLIDAGICSEQTPFLGGTFSDERLPEPPAGKAERPAAPKAHLLVPGDMVSFDQLTDMAGRLAHGQTVVGDSSIFDAMWPERPALPSGVIKPQPLEWAGDTPAHKLAALRETLRAKMGAKGRYVLGDLSDIAWLLNLRGADIDCNPLFIAWLTYEMEADRFTLFTHYETMMPEARRQTEEAGVALRTYADFANALKEGGEDSPLWFDFATSPASLSRMSRSSILPLPSPVAPLRAVKNRAEQDGFRQAMARDGVALVKFLHWLDEARARGERLTEMSIDARLTALRADQPGFDGLSFPTIAGFGPHGAIVHYEATAETDAAIEGDGLLLLDSGAQYDCGTTDITRTLSFGTPGAEERRVTTLVLKGHLALQRLVFPDGATGLQLDLAARQAMWAEGYDFGHGTGHGVGSHLCVHEGPQQIRKNPRNCTLIPFRAGMTITDEPGIYVEGKFGVRIENTLLVVPDRTTPYGTFLRFEPLTLCPYDLRAVDINLLSIEERRQIDDYHALVADRLMPLLDDMADREWLCKATRPILA